GDGLRPSAGRGASRDDRPVRRRPRPDRDPDRPPPADRARQARDARHVPPAGSRRARSRRHPRRAGLAAADRAGMTTVIALGGNALTRAGERGTAAEQLANLRAVSAAFVPLLDDPQVVITHGNGPQVGNELVRQERAADEVPPLPLYIAVAQTQAEIGAL